MTDSIFKKSVVISLLGHITVLSIFSFSFGQKIPKMDCASVAFWGQFLLHSQVIQPTGNPLKDIKPIKEAFVKKPEIMPQDKVKAGPSLLTGYYLKPALALKFNTEKKDFIQKSTPALFLSKRRESTIILHPLLPYSFTLYFKDRQVAHVELTFNIATKDEHSYTEIKRRISSGNLEVDLLCMRYISHYLFIQQARFTPSNWQTLKIDLSAKND